MLWSQRGEEPNLKERMSHKLDFCVCFIATQEFSVVQSDRLFCLKELLRSASGQGECEEGQGEEGGGVRRRK